MSIITIAGLAAILLTVIFLTSGKRNQLRVVQGLNILGIMVGVFCLILLGVLFFAIVTA